MMDFWPRSEIGKFWQSKWDGTWWWWLDCRQRDCSLYREMDNKNLGNKLIGVEEKRTRSKDTIER